MVGKRRFSIVSLLSAVCAGWIAGCPNGGNSDLPKPGTDAYNQTVSAFTIGTVALETVNLNLIEPNLKRASELAPGEPAIWANLAVQSLRTNRFEDAAKFLEKAKGLGGDDDRLMLIEGLVAEKKGDFDAALSAYLRATERNPRNLKALFLVAKTADTRNAADRMDAMAKALDRILEVSPGNQLVLTERMKVAAEAGDRSTLRARAAFFLPRLASLPAASVSLLRQIESAPESTPNVALKRYTTLFQNTLRPLPDFQAGLREVTFEGANIGQPLSRFIKMVNPPATAAPPDTELAFTISDAPVAGVGAYVASLDEKSVPQWFAFEKTGLKTSQGLLSAPIDPVAVAAFDLDDEVGTVPSDDQRRYRLDLAVAGTRGMRLFLSQGGKLSDVTASAKLPAAVVSGSYSGVWTLDYEGDGDLDLMLSRASAGPVVLQNNGNKTFAVVPKPAFSDVPGPLRDFGWMDIDADGDADALLVDTKGTLHVYANERSGLFQKRETPSALENLVSLAVMEATGDTTLDAVLLEEEGNLSVLADSGDGRTWAELRKLGQSSVAKPQRVLAADLDNNGAVDLAVANRENTEVLLAGPDGKLLPPGEPVALGATVALDTDRDGLVDLVGQAADQGKLAVAKGKSTRKYSWQAFTLRAKKPNSPTVKINAFAMGGEVETRAGLLYQKRPITGPQVHIGLGEAPALDIARVVWPSGVAQSEAGDDLIKGPMVADQRLSGSCPFLFTWDGTKMVFVTDCIWRSPLGLKINAQDTAGVTQTEDWVKVRGDQLRPRNGSYELSITAELQETHFFDKVALKAVDHPVGTEIFVDERFSPTEAPRLEVIGTKQPRQFAAVLGNQGQDVSGVVDARDGRYVDDFGRTRYQGIAGDHHIELVFPANAPRGKVLYLIGSGWLHPTDTSVNVALSQDPSMPPPSGLVMETRNQAGKWVPVRRGLGFPAGKLKTIVLRIDDVLPESGDRRIRLRTNLEIFWDQLRWAEAIPSDQLRIQTMAPFGAELRFRGFSEIRAQDASSPELPTSYERLAGGAPVWRDLEGFHTRFGDVKPLVGRVDDRYVIMNAGDEMALRFRQPADPAAGLVRDFVFVGDGWEKDGNINTTFGKTVLPLPAHAVSDYKIPPSTLENDPVFRRHRNDWEIYHTRYVTPRAFVGALKP